MDVMHMIAGGGSMWNIPLNNKLTYEGMQERLKSNDYLIINTLKEDQQGCLIKNTVHASSEVDTVEHALEMNKPCIVYGKNHYDESIYKKYKQLKNLGFSKVYIYAGGMFEWMLLQDVYGADDFPTTNRELDILKYRPITNG